MLLLLLLLLHAAQVATASRQRADSMATSFEASLKEMARTIKSVQVTIADRAAALGMYAQVRRLPVRVCAAPP